MLRRKPTRLELKLDDIEEFESIRKDLEAARKKQKEAMEGAGTSGGGGAAGPSGDPKGQEQVINDPTGSKSQLKSDNRTSQFGN